MNIIVKKYGLCKTKHMVLVRVQSDDSHTHTSYHKDRKKKVRNVENIKTFEGKKDGGEGREGGREERTEKRTNPFSPAAETTGHFAILSTIHTPTHHCDVVRVAAAPKCDDVSEQ